MLPDHDAYRRSHEREHLQPLRHRAPSSTAQIQLKPKNPRCAAAIMKQHKASAINLQHLC